MNKVTRNLDVFDLVVFFLIVLPLSSIWSGWVITVLWAWFVVPTFHLQVLTLVPAMGLATLVNYFTVHVSNDDKSQSTMGDIIGTCIVRPLIFLVSGWIIHFFM